MIKVNLPLLFFKKNIIFVLKLRLDVSKISLKGVFLQILREQREG